jgi:hypothetical protein
VGFTEEHETRGRPVWYNLMHTMKNPFYKLVGTVSAVVLLGAIPAVVSRPQTSATSPAQNGVKQAASRLDAACERAWEEAGKESGQPFTPMGAADSLTVIRRLSLALCGTIPSLEEIRAIEKVAPDAQIDTHLEHLLSDRRYADYLAERLARAFVGTEDGPFLVYRRRRFVYWLSDELLRSPSDPKYLSYDALVRAVISSEGLWTDHPATNFVTARVIENKGPDPLALAARTTRAFLGIRIDCAQCHDHPFTSWKQKDFEGLAAFFSEAKQSFRGIEDRPEELKVVDIKTKEEREVAPRFPFAPDAGASEGHRRQQLAEWVTTPKLHEDSDGNSHDYFAEAIANRAWTLMFGQGITEPVDDLEGQRRLPGVLEELARDFRENGHDLRRLIRVIASTRAFRMASGDGSEISEEQEKLYAAFPMTRLRSEQIAGALVQASSLQTVDADSHIVVRTLRFFNTNDFIKSYGDAGEEELNAHIGTIPQRLVMMNGKMPRERIQASPLNAAGRVSRLAPSDETRVRIVYLIALSRNPTDQESEHFVARLKELKTADKHQGIEDILWALFNSTEFSWNH